jgi:hypothetical protein
MTTTSYFDINGRIGKGVFGTSESEYPDPASLLAHLDYLGVARALVWDYEARDSNPTRGNRTLLEKIARKSEFQQRLIPVFTITPASVLDRDGVDALKTHLGDGSVRALRVFPYSPRFNLGALNMLLEKLRDFSPVILWSGIVNRAELKVLCELAERFNHFTFVLAETGWISLIKGLDLLRSRQNVLVDTSALYTEGAIEILLDLLGEDRVVFGTGSKTHYGASIAALEHSRVSAAAKEKIAHGNIERILNLSPCKTAMQESPLLKDKPLWKKFKTGQTLSGIEIIDAHGHSGPYSYCGWTPTNDLKAIFDNIVRKMDALGVSRMILSHIPALYGDCLEGNRELERILSGGYRNRISGYLAFNPYYQDVMAPELDKFFTGGVFKGFKLLADYWQVPVTDPAYEPVWKYADEHFLPVLLHTWQGIYSSPALLTDIVKKYPQAIFILGHSGGGKTGREEAEILARKNRNVFLEFCGSFTAPVDWTDTFEKLGFEKVLFGSDADGHDQAWELGRLLSVPVPDNKLLPVLAGNIKNILAKSETQNLKEYSFLHEIYKQHAGSDRQYAAPEIK